MVDLSKLKLVEAKLKHYEPLLEISKDVYDGFDYIEQVYKEWISEEQTDPQKRRNLVLLDEADRVIGYQSFYFQEEGRKVVAQALRIDGGLRGQGVGRQFSQLCKQYLLEMNPEVSQIYQ